MFNHQLFIEKLNARLKEALPGEDAQHLMVPISRKKYSELIGTVTNPRLSAVLILLYPHENTIKTILIKRPEYDGVHSGQIAFPGGKHENEDESLLHTALRETKEEIGVQLSSAHIIGELTKVYIQPSNFLVYPYIAYAPAKPDIIHDLYEAESFIEVDVFTLCDESIKKEKDITLANGLKIKTPYFDVEGNTVWGATAMMISELNAIINSI